MQSFNDLGLGAPIQRALAELDYATPTPIQAQALPIALSGRDLIACANTGSGKTAVFALPFLQRLLAAQGNDHSARNGAQRNGSTARSTAISRPKCLVLVPTRELAIQVESAFRRYGRYTPVRSAAVYGGVGYGAQLSALRRGVDVLVATPGRLLDLIERGAARLDAVQYLVLDEADRMLDLGFLPQVRRVVAEGRIPAHGRQTLLFSATMPPQIAQLAKEYLTTPERVEAEAPMSAVATIEQRLYPVAQSQKADLLVKLVEVEGVESALIFTRTRRRADSLSRSLNRSGLRNEAIHSDVPQRRREQVLTAFRQGRIRFLVATDVASRGLDIPALSHVINHDVPDMAADYVHRIGRTGRAGRSGVAITLFSKSDQALWTAVEQLTATSLDATRLAGFSYEVDTSEPVLTRRQRAEQTRQSRSPAKAPAQRRPQQPQRRQAQPARRRGSGPGSRREQVRQGR